MKRCLIIMLIILGLMANAMGLASQVLEQGADGETVQVLTRRLAELGYIEQAVDEYDDSVASAIADFQTANGLNRTGVADIETQRLMNSASVVTRSQYITGFVALYAGQSYASGSSGDVVRQIQEKLSELEYYDSVCDGKFGEGTRRAVVDYQRANGLEPTGIVEHSMLLRLFEGESVRYADYVAGNCAIRGDAGANVKALQDRLNVLGYYTGDSTGTYGDNTYRAVLRFQGDNGLTQSGNVDVETYEALFDENAAHAQDDESMSPGDSGNQVYSMQLLLKSLGFYDEEPSSEYDINTETAVRLFRAANGMEISSEATADMLNLLYSGQARSVDALPYGKTLDAEAGERIFAEACAHIGDIFPKTGNMYNGYSLVEYVLAGEGVRIEFQEEFILLMDEGDSTEYAVPGDVIVMSRQMTDFLTLCFAVAGSDGQAVCMNSETGVIELGTLEDIGYLNAYVWNTVAGHQ